MSNCGYCNKPFQPGERVVRSSTGELYHDGDSLLEQIRACSGRAIDHALYTGAGWISMVSEEIFGQGDQTPSQTSLDG